MGNTTGRTHANCTLHAYDRRNFKLQPAIRCVRTCLTFPNVYVQAPCICADFSAVITNMPTVVTVTVVASVGTGSTGFSKWFHRCSLLVAVCTHIVPIIQKRPRASTSRRFWQLIHSKVLCSGHLMVKYAGAHLQSQTVYIRLQGHRRQNCDMMRTVSPVAGQRQSNH